MVYRAEDKYVLPWHKMTELEHKIAVILPPDRFSVENGRGYTISSLYFDDVCDTCLMDSINGNPIRDKYRIRIYNHSLKVIKLEVKRKRYNRAYKVSSTISEDELVCLRDGVAIEGSDSLDDARTLFNLAINRRGLRPKVIVTYDRRAYVCDAGNVRVTFDRHLRCSDWVDGFGATEIVYDYPEGTRAVLEVKYDQVLPKFVAQVLESGDLIQTANSKYALCRGVFER